MRVEQCAPWNLTSKELRQCRALTFTYGMMKPTLREAIETRQGRVFFLKDPDEDRIVSWAIVVPHRVVRPGSTGGDRPTAMFYTRENCRRLGYGSQILRVVRHRYKKVGTYSHTAAAEAFFGRSNKKAYRK